MKNTLRGQHLLSLRDWSRADIERLLDCARRMEEAMAIDAVPKSLQGRIMASLFFQPSTRTRLSFEAAMHRLGGEVIGFSDVEHTRSGSGWKEPLDDTARVISNYADVAVIRHSEVGAPRSYAAQATMPVINAGDGIGPRSEHPTQALLDLYTIQKAFGRLTGIRILLIGGMHQRAAHSLLVGLSKFKYVTVDFLCPDGYWLSQNEEAELVDAGVSIHRVRAIEEVLREVDVIYHNGMSEDANDAIPPEYRITAETLRGASKGTILLHPLPRAGEIARDVDALGQARFFDQAANGIPVRMAVLHSLFHDA